MEGPSFGSISWLLAFVLTLSGAARAPAQTDPPVITAQPQSQTVPAASTVTFNVTITGSEPLFYQWHKDGTNLANSGRISGATATTLTVSNAQGSEMGYYSVVVTNAYGSATSSNASLTLWPVVGWGYNSHGESTPPAGLTNVVALAGGYYHRVTLTEAGSVVARGHTNSGQTSVPAGATNGVAVAAGAYHSLVLRTDGRRGRLGRQQGRAGHCASGLVERGGGGRRGVSQPRLEGGRPGGGVEHERLRPNQCPARLGERGGDCRGRLP